MNAPVKIPHAIVRPVAGEPIFTVTKGDTIAIRPGAVVDGIAFHQETPVAWDDPRVGADYAVMLIDGRPTAVLCADGVPPEAIGGFHNAPGWNAPARTGGRDVPRINPCSIWDAGFRPACPDPRGMALVEHSGLRFWCDIYLLGREHLRDGTSRFGVEIADGDALPQALDGQGRTAKLDYPTATVIYAHHGKQLLGAEEFFAAAYGVKERSAAATEPDTTGLDAARTSRFGIMQATGNMWVWGTDGDPDDPRPSIFGGSWLCGVLAGSRCAHLDFWPDSSSDDISARGRSDHLMPE